MLRREKFDKKFGYPIDIIGISCYNKRQSEQKQTNLQERRGHDEKSRCKNQQHPVCRDG